MQIYWFGTLIVLSLTITRGQCDDSPPNAESTGKAENKDEKLLETEMNSSNQQQKLPRFFYKAQSTTTLTDVSVATITVFSSCISTLRNNVVCSRKRRKRQIELGVNAQKG